VHKLERKEKIEDLDKKVLELYDLKFEFNSKSDFMIKKLAENSKTTFDNINLLSLKLKDLSAPYLEKIADMKMAN
jgi:hypothetical protein